MSAKADQRSHALVAQSNYSTVPGTACENMQPKLILDLSGVGGIAKKTKNKKLELSRNNIRKQ